MSAPIARPLVIDGLAAEFARVAEREASRRRRHVGRPTLVAFATTLLVAATAYAAGLLPIGEPVEAPPKGDIPARLLPQPGSVRIDSIRVADPSAGPAWGLRLATTAAGASCFAFGRVHDGQFGVVDAAGRFRRLPAAGTGTCTDLTVEPVAFDVRRTGGAASRGRTLIGGLAGGEVTRVVIAGGTSTRELVPTRAGGFLAVFAGQLRLSELRLVAHFRDGTKRALLAGSTRGG